MTETIVNPIIEQRADPWIMRHTDGYYYFTASLPDFSGIPLRRAQTIGELTKAEEKVVWQKRSTGIMSANIWAPELHHIQGKWYLYFAAAREDAIFDHRMYVLENSSANPLEGQWTEKGQIKTWQESFALDATTFEHENRLYYIWAQKDPKIEGNSNLYISEMENPWTLTGPQTMIATPEYAWEKVGFLVNEGPAVLKRNGYIYVTFSASATDHNYCVGFLRINEKEDMLDATHWEKYPQPVLTTNESIREYGPGHNSFTTLADGTDMIVYHARNYREIEGDPLWDPNRHTYVRPFSWQGDVPVFENRMVNEEVTR
ncbi:family 43 glycosylhydrolase [Exiguobacterium sp. RIT341]|uniref:glycoside hydrolase family 43 protein n=1 Tax=Exiguobacterium sp. RIT341 TaxID=1470592 RepID=UPI00044C095F|nr:glycoside hydrolase family 43 protein [Exiguobacterium sp. RIT341]EZP61432.1 Extracellular exo-alpha-(1->5)-L-arabinofuranosidase precursor [Exiguobacterium sp. RIT341]